MPQPEQHILAADIGGTHTGVAIFAHHGKEVISPVRHKIFRSRDVADFPSLLGGFLKKEGARLMPPVQKACIDFAGPVGPDRSEGFITNLQRGFTAREILRATGLETLTLLNDFEAVGFGIEVLIANRPDAFVRISRSGRLPRGSHKRTAAIIGAGTGLGTAILSYDKSSRRYRPIPGEGGHTDFIAVEEEEFQVAQWIRSHVNRSPRDPVDCEKIVSGPGLVNLYRALQALQSGDGPGSVFRKVSRADPYDRPAIIIKSAAKDPLCRKALDIWLRCYGRAAKNGALFPLAPGGVFLAGGVAARILDEMRSGVFMKEFVRCDVPNIRALLKRTPVFVVTDYRAGLYGCANVAVNFQHEFGP